MIGNWEQSNIEPDGSEQNVVEHKDMEQNGMEQNDSDAAYERNLREDVQVFPYLFLGKALRMLVIRM